MTNKENSSKETTLVVSTEKESNVTSPEKEESIGSFIPTYYNDRELLRTDGKLLIKDKGNGLMRKTQKLSNPIVPNGAKINPLYKVLYHVVWYQNGVRIKYLIFGEDKKTVVREVNV